MAGRRGQQQACSCAAHLHLALLLSGHQAPQLVDVDGRAVKLVQSLVEVTHTNFAEITGMAAEWREGRQGGERGHMEPRRIKTEEKRAFPNQQH